MADEGSEWVKLDDVSDQVRGENWSLYWGEAKSDSDYFARLLREPLAVLQEEIDGVGPDWRVITQMVNHHVPYFVGRGMSSGVGDARREDRPPDLLQAPSRYVKTFVRLTF